MPDSFDVFLSYAHADSEWVRRLAENLHQSGLNVFFDEWEIGPGDVLVHQLGIIAQNRGAYDEALEWYRKSLAIKEELGDRAGMASSYGQIADLLTECGVPEEGLPLNLTSLAIHLELGSPNAGFNLRVLTRQRELLGEERFLSIIREQLDEDGVRAVLSLLEEFTSEK